MLSFRTCLCNSGILIFKESASGILIGPGQVLRLLKYQLHLQKNLNNLKQEMHQKLNRGRNLKARLRKGHRKTLWALRLSIWAFIAAILAGCGAAVYYSLKELEVRH